MDMTSFRIEKGIPLPAPKTPASKYPFNKMEIGDSFVFTKSGSSWAGIYAAMKVAQRKHNIKLTSTQISEHERRIWRTA